MRTNSVTSNSTPVTFQGKFIIKDADKMPRKVIQALKTSPYLGKMAEKNDVVVRLMTKKTDIAHYAYFSDKKLYNLKFSVLPENSLFAQIKEALHLTKSHKISGTYHTKNGIARRLMDYRYSKVLLHKFSIEI